MKKILGMGNALLDILVALPGDSVLTELGLAKGSMQLVDLAFSERVLKTVENLDFSLVSGGSASNTIHGLAKLGVETSFIGKVSNDEFGSIFEKDMETSSIRPILFRDEPQTGRAIALITPDSERTFATYLGSAVKLAADELTLDLFKGYDLFHVEGYLVQDHDLIERSLVLAKEAGLTTSLDLASFNVVVENLGFLQSIVSRYVDIVFANEEEARSFTGLPAEESALKIAEMCKIAVVKTGPKGSLVACGKDLLTIPPVDAKRVDTTGAGDLYASGFLYGYVNGLPLEKSAMAGTILAACVIEKIGAKIPDECWPEMVKKIKAL
ncbi:adenosine kinase [bacterium]|nr:adenosine kinase [bacterium]MBQ4438990.1 adenosine kinase [bacterium]